MEFEWENKFSLKSSPIAEPHLLAMCTNHPHASKDSPKIAKIVKNMKKVLKIFYFNIF
jgi:hypothetical protein